MCILCRVVTINHQPDLSWREWFASWGPWLGQKWSDFRGESSQRQACGKFLKLIGLNIANFNLRVRDAIVDTVIIYMFCRFFSEHHFDYTFGSSTPHMFGNATTPIELESFWKAPDTAIMTAGALALFLMGLPLKRLLSRESQEAISLGVLGVHAAGFGIVYATKTDEQHTLEWQIALLILSAPPVVSMIFHILGAAPTVANGQKWKEAMRKAEIAAGKPMPLEHMPTKAVKVSNAILSTTTRATLMGAAMVAYTVSVIQEFYNGTHATDLHDQAEIMKIMGIIGIITGGIANIIDLFIARKIPQAKWVPYIAEHLEHFLTGMFSCQAYFMTYDIYRDTSVLGPKGYRDDSREIDTGYSFAMLSVVLGCLTDMALPELEHLEGNVARILGLITGFGAIPVEYADMSLAEIRADLKRRFPDEANMPPGLAMEMRAVPRGPAAARHPLKERLLAEDMGDQ